MLVYSFLSKFRCGHCFFFFFPICFQLPKKFSSLENRKKKFENRKLGKKQLPNCGGQKHKATITGFEFRINKTNLLRMGDGNPQGEDHKDNWRQI